ncbi:MULTISPECIES: hypothetical protein [Photorhabdus]|uniref:Uncharacterized protein n=2 Tax=Photorhabdus TaxID=29487 RepID=A0A7X5QHL4_9GAMM|nr:MULTISPECIES: hypothetical protein [Photorhabdus]AWK42623.1 hypothetical protein A4R40_14545 [Photorhabdus laumondii subsp. laumondii]AXG47948.1 hypothetical protein PluTT01m_14965 [Photorhabdus laumondii subsp. laumondii]KER01103.1 hypothetical protein MEG1DRAFT_04313 [Photorhabdus temperata subsp. temperata Meg1]NHB94464.1 hypothetical protein [Photorhabdus cinerea]
MSEERTFLPCKCGGKAINCWVLRDYNDESKGRWHYHKCRRCQNESQSYPTLEESEIAWNKKVNNGG